MLRPMTILAAATLLALPAYAQRTMAPEGAEVFIISPADGATVSNPVTIRFGLSGMGVAPAGVEHPNTGHHHVLINVGANEIDFDEPIPADERFVHFGGGQTEVTMNLPTGTHSVMLLLGDAFHVPHDPPVMSAPITITVQ